MYFAFVALSRVKKKKEKKRARAKNRPELINMWLIRIFNFYRAELQFSFCHVKFNSDKMNTCVRLFAATHYVGTVMPLSELM